MVKISVDSILSKIPLFGNPVKKDIPFTASSEEKKSNSQCSVKLHFLQEKIPAVNINNLHSHLNLNQVCMYPESSHSKAYLDWKMEIDDAPIFRYLYRNFQPRRHLEFGTWEGFGTRLCLEETAATVWTLNIPFGERDPADNTRICYSYSDNKESIDALKRWAEKIGVPEEVLTGSRRTDCIGFIGRYYLEKDLGNRVCQIYCDSQKWDISHYPSGFFDSVLIDGGHSKEIVTNDTRKAFQLIKSGGLILWHDFCMDHAIYQNFQATRGVLDSVYENWDFIHSNVQDLFWIEPSFILVGIRK